MNSEEREKRIEELRKRVTERQKLKEDVEEVEFNIWQHWRRNEDEQKFSSLLITSPGAEFIGYREHSERIIAPYVLYTKIRDYDYLRRKNRLYRPDTHKIRIDADQNALRHWLQGITKSILVSDRCFVVCGSYLGSVRWAEVQLLDPHLWFWNLWTSIDNKEFVLLSEHHENTVGIFPHELDYIGCLCDIDELLNLGDRP